MIAWSRVGRVVEFVAIRRSGAFDAAETDSLRSAEWFVDASRSIAFQLAPFAVYDGETSVFRVTPRTISLEASRQFRRYGRLFLPHPPVHHFADGFGQSRRRGKPRTRAVGVVIAAPAMMSMVTVAVIATGACAETIIFQTSG